MKTFEQWNRRDLRLALMDRGWMPDFHAREDRAGQLRGWYQYKYAGIRGMVSVHRSLRNAAKIAGLIK